MQPQIVGVPFTDPKYEVLVVALHKAKSSGVFGYLQSARKLPRETAGLKLEETSLARHYKAMLFHYTAQLVNSIEGPVDALLSPPSDHGWQAEPYRESLSAKFTDAFDLTSRFSREGMERSGRNATLEQMIASLTYNPTGREQDFLKIVIVDDTLARGTTAAAIVTHLRMHGMSNNCNVVVACPLWLDTVKSATPQHKPSDGS